MKTTKPRFSREALLKWIDGDPKRDAVLITEVPVKASTLIRIKAGHYPPSERMGNAIMNVIEKDRAIA